MKRVLTLALTVFLGTTLALAQATGGDKTKLNPQPLPPGSHKTTETASTSTTQKKKGGKKGHKGGKKSKKGSAGTTSPSTPK